MNSRDTIPITPNTIRYYVSGKLAEINLGRWHNTNNPRKSGDFWGTPVIWVGTDKKWRIFVGRSS